MPSYLFYVVRHKWFVFLECCKLGIPWLGIIHDLSRLYPNEFLAYAASAPYDKENKPSDIAIAFEYAWNNHQHFNKHHFEYWIHFDYYNHQKRLLPIPDRYRREMLADWRGAARAHGNTGTPKDWYLRSSEQIQLHPETRQWIERQLGVTVSSESETLDCTVCDRILPINKMYSVDACSERCQDEILEYQSVASSSN